MLVFLNSNFKLNFKRLFCYIFQQTTVEQFFHPNSNDPGAAKWSKSTALSMASHLLLSIIALFVKSIVKIYSTIIRHDMDTFEKGLEKSIVKTLKDNTSKLSTIPSLVVVSLFTICLLIVPFTDRNFRLLWVAPTMVTIFTILIPLCIIVSNSKMALYFKFQIHTFLGKFGDNQITPIV